MSLNKKVFSPQQPETKNILDPKNIIQYYLPYLILAGDYSLEIQSRVCSQKDKAEKTLSAQALTDADLSVQNMIEVATLARFPEFSCDLEENDTSINIKYFPTNSNISLILDPINGTKSYKEGLPLFDIILTIVKDKNIVAAVTYIPAQKNFYIGLKNQGAFKTTKEDVRNNKPWRKHTLPKPRSNRVLTSRCPKAIQDKLKTLFTTNDTRDYDNPNTTRDVTTFNILDGNIIAYAKLQSHIRDCGAISFIAEEAGGVVSDMEGKPIPCYCEFEDKKIPSIIVSISKKIHAKIIGIFKKTEIE